MNRVIIDNCVVSKLGDNVLEICSIRRAKKKNPDLDLDLVPRIRYANRLEDNLVISKLIEGAVKFDDLILTHSA